MPKFDATQFVGKSNLQTATQRQEQVNLNTLQRYFPKEIELLLKKYPVNRNENDKKWDYVKK